MDTKEIPGEKEINTIKNKRMEFQKLPKQCGLVYSENGNALVNSGLQPFVVEIKIKKQEW